MRNYTIGVLYEDKAQSGLTHDFFSAILDGFMKQIEEYGYTLCFLNTNKTCPGRKTYLEQVKERQYDGVMITCIEFDDPEVVELMESGLPVVTIDEEADGVLCVKSDNDGGMKELIRYIIGMNHRRIAYITGEECRVTRTRLEAFLNGCREAGIEVMADYIKQGKFRDINRAAYLTETLMRLPDPPSCIIYPDDYAAIGGINVLRARGLDVPGDISVAGYDGIDILSQYEPRITTVVQNKRKLGGIAGRQLIRWVEQGLTQAGQTITVDTDLQKGRSVAKAYY